MRAQCWHWLSSYGHCSVFVSASIVAVLRGAMAWWLRCPVRQPSVASDYKHGSSPIPVVTQSASVAPRGASYEVVGPGVRCTCGVCVGRLFRPCRPIAGCAGAIFPRGFWVRQAIQPVHREAQGHGLSDGAGLVGFERCWPGGCHCAPANGDTQRATARRRGAAQQPGGKHRQRLVLRLARIAKQADQVS